MDRTDAFRWIICFVCCRLLFVCVCFVYCVLASAHVFAHFKFCRAIVDQFELSVFGFGPMKNIQNVVACVWGRHCFALVVPLLFRVVLSVVCICVRIFL